MMTSIKMSAPKNGLIETCAVDASMVMVPAPEKPSIKKNDNKYNYIDELCDKADSNSLQHRRGRVMRPCFGCRPESPLCKRTRCLLTAGIARYLQSSR